MKPNTSKKIPSTTKIEDAEPLMATLDGEEFDLHETLLYYMKDALEIAIEELETVRKDWGHCALSSDSTFGISIDIVENVRHTLRFANLIPEKRKKTTKIKNPGNQKP